MQTKKLILILGLGHSGTTILDMILGCSPQIVGLGEALRTLDNDLDKWKDTAWEKIRSSRLDEQSCSCGRPASECQIWSHGAELTKGTTLDENFARLYDIAVKANPGVKYVLDSTPGAVRYLDHVTGFDIRAIHLVRDVRSWTMSEIRRSGVTQIEAFDRWRRSARRIRAALESRNIPYFRLGYEEFALKPEASLKLLCDWLEVDYTDTMLCPAEHSKSHAIAGNSLLRDRRKFSGIRYDGSWLANPEKRLLRTLLFLRVARLNDELVYGNGVLNR